MKSHNAVSQPTYPTFLYNWGRYTHDLNWFHGWRHHLTSYKIDSFTSQVGHHIATTSSPLFASAPNFLAGLGCAGCLRQPRQGATAFFMRAARRKEHHCSQVTSLFFSIFRDMYGVFYLNVCLFFRSEWVLVWVWFSRIVFWKTKIIITDGTTVSCLSHRDRAKCMFLYLEGCLATAKWQFWHQLRCFFSLLFWKDFSGNEYILLLFL